MSKTLRRLIADNTELKSVVLIDPKEKYMGLPIYTINNTAKENSTTIITGTKQTIRARNNITSFTWKINNQFHPALDYNQVN